MLPGAPLYGWENRYPEVGVLTKVMAPPSGGAEIQVRAVRFQNRVSSLLCLVASDGACCENTDHAIGSSGKVVVHRVRDSRTAHSLHQARPQPSPGLTTLFERSLVSSIVQMYVIYGHLSGKFPHIFQELGLGGYTLGKTSLNYLVEGQLKIVPWEWSGVLACQCLWGLTPHQGPWLAFHSGTEQGGRWLPCPFGQASNTEVRAGSISDHYLDQQLSTFFISWHT